jgi:hypothetical protein
MGGKWTLAFRSEATQFGTMPSLINRLMRESWRELN